MNVDLKSLALTQQECANLGIIGQNSAQAQQEGTFSACFSHLVNLEQVLGTFQTSSDPFTTELAAPQLVPQ
jgi:sulfatase maturation enzyme AslB (radical SAM superfamily)